MKSHSNLIAIVLPALACSLPAQSLPPVETTLAQLRLANRWFMQAWPDPGKAIVTNRERPSNIWTRSVYYEGLLALHALDPNPAYLDYTRRWAEFHQWGMRNGTKTRNADDQCCAQAYLALYEMDPMPERIAKVKENIDFIVAGERNDDWWWIDALQMAMPVYAKLGVITKDPRYVDNST